MTVGQRIRSIRKEKGLTQKALGELLGVTQATVGQYETNPNPPKIETLQNIAEKLSIPLTYLLGPIPVPWDAALDQKLAQVGCSVGFYEDDAVLWINYPDGTLEVTDAELKELNDSTDFYLRFKLEELKNQRKEKFRPHNK